MKKPSLLNDYKQKLNDVITDINALRRDNRLPGSSSGFLARLTSKFKNALEPLFNARNKADRVRASKRLRSAYYMMKSDLKRNSRGLASYRLKDLDPKFKELYQQYSANCLNLITSLNEEEKQKVYNRFYNWLTLESSGVKNKEHLRELTRIRPNKRSRFIMRDQSNKLTSAMDYTVSRAYKAIAFQWKTRYDDRVVGKPGGLYPKGSSKHGNHYKRRDKFYYYHENLTDAIRSQLNLKAFEGAAEDLHDGLPGMPIGCRCYAIHYYRVKDLPKKLLKEQTHERV